MQTGLLPEPLKTHVLNLIISGNVKEAQALYKSWLSKERYCDHIVAHENNNCINSKNLR
jgi:hypothetical protein